MIYSLPFSWQSIHLINLILKWLLALIIKVCKKKEKKLWFTFSSDSPLYCFYCFFYWFPLNTCLIHLFFLPSKTFNMQTTSLARKNMRVLILYRWGHILDVMKLRTRQKHAHIHTQKKEIFPFQSIMLKSVHWSVTYKFKLDILSVCYHAELWNSVLDTSSHVCKGP